MAVLVIKSLDEIRQIAIEHLTEGSVLSVEFVGKETDEFVALYD